MMGQGTRPAGPSNGGLKRAIAYMKHDWRLAGATYVAVLLATLSQLAIPQLVQDILDAVVQGAQATFSGGTANERAIWLAMGTIVLFAAIRGLFTFAQGYLAERSSQNVAFDMRNELFEKVQRLSFSYHDRNQTGQLMIRATDDVEKVRGFLGQGLVMTVQAVVLLVGILIILFITNARLTLVVLPILPIAHGAFHDLRRDQPAALWRGTAPPLGA